MKSVKSVIRLLFPRVPSLLLKIKLLLQNYSRGVIAREGCTRGNKTKITDCTDCTYPGRRGASGNPIIPSQNFANAKNRQFIHRNNAQTRRLV